MLLKHLKLIFITFLKTTILYSQLFKLFITSLSICRRHICPLLDIIYIKYFRIFLAIISFHV